MHVFATTSQTQLTRPDKFYSKSGSSTSNYIDITNLYNVDTSGFSFKTQLVSDYICISETYCYMADFMSVMAI